MKIKEPSVEMFIKDDVLVLPKGVNTIAPRQFEANKKIIKLTLKNSIKHLDYYAFCECRNLQQIFLPKVKTIGSNCFYGCHSLNDVVLPNSLKQIGTFAFADCKNLQQITLPKNLKKLETKAFTECKNLTKVNFLAKNLDIGVGAFSECENLSFVTLPKNLKLIPVSAFLNCKNLTFLTLPKTLKVVDTDAFRGCDNLFEISLPKNLEYLGIGAFDSCSSLINITIPKKIDVVRSRTFLNCNLLKQVVLPNSLKQIEGHAFKGCKNLKNITLPQSLLHLGAFAFKNCESLTSISIPKDVTFINKSTFEGCQNLQFVDLNNVVKVDDNAFSLCPNLKLVKLSKNLEEVGQNAFSSCPLNFMYSKNNQTFLSSTLPTDANVVNVVNLNTLKQQINSYVLGFDMSILLVDGNAQKYQNLLKTLKHNNFKIPAKFASELDSLYMLEDFAQNSVFKYFKNEVLNNKDLKDTNLTMFYDEVLKFANCMGCFTNEFMLDEHNNKTNTLVAQKASSFLYGALKSNTLRPWHIHSIFKHLPLDAKVSQDFLNFISQKGKDKEYTNLQMLLTLEKIDIGIFTKVMTNFDKVKSLRTTIDANGKPIKLSWQQACHKFYQVDDFKNVNKDNLALAQLYSRQGLTQADFDEASSEHKFAKKNNIKEHILNQPLTEDKQKISILQSVEDIKNQIDNNIASSYNNLNSAYKNVFTYEMLNKLAPENSIIGLYTSCCATICSYYYGKDIALSPLRSNDVQNMVVRDSSGQIVAKGTMYVNQKLGYIVFNDFELNDKYKQHQTSIGTYNDADFPQMAKSRSQIFDAFMRGINAFVSKYDNLHPQNPIKKVTVGMGYNRLKSLCQQFKVEQNNLYVPEKYNFQDAKKGQYVLYEKS